jgi:dienelactone hydrolase
MSNRIVKSFLLALICLFTPWLAGVSQAQNVNPHLGWFWKKVDFATLDQDRAQLTLHYRLQSERDAPAVLIGHDNGGISDNEKAYAEFMYSQGFHVFALDRITGRKRVARPLEVFLVADTFAAARFIRLTFNDTINTDRLSYASFSGDGGFGGLMAIEPKARRLFNPEAPDLLKFHRVATIYPHCVHVKDGSPDTPTLIIGAELDASDPKVCQGAYAASPLVKVEIYPGAYHGFDQATLRQKTWIAKPVTMPGQCAWRLDLDRQREAQGHRYFMLFSPGGAPIQSREFFEYTQSCSTHLTGYFSEYRSDLTRNAYEATVSFFRN